MKKYLLFFTLLLFSLPAYATTSTINPAVPAANSPLSSSVMRNNFGAAYNDINALWAAIAAGATVTWPTSGYVVLSNATNSPAGVAEVDGDCLKGVAGVWATGACGSGGSGLVVGTTTITSGTNGDVEYNNNGVLGELSPATTVNGQSCALGGACTAAAAAGTLTGTTLNSTVVSSSLTSLGTIATGVWHGTKVGLAYGGTNADLSATGGTSEVLKQVSSGAAVTVAQLACSDLSNAAASCSTDATDASNISSGLLASTLGGTGVDNTATLTLGSSNQNWATLGTGIVKNTTTTGALSDAASSDIIALFSTCSGTQYLGADGSCHNASGSGVSSFTGDGTILSNSGSTGAVTASLENAGAGTVLGNASSSATTPSYSSTPQLGKSGTLGSIAMGNATSGLLTLEPATGALGTVTVSIPAATDTLVNLAGTQTLTNKTITFSGNTLTGVAPLASPTFSGTVTAPDSSTWTSSGIGSLAALGVGETAPAAGIINVSSKYEVGGSQISCSSLSNGATGCSTATGTSGGTIPLLNGANTWSGVQTVTQSDLRLLGSSTGYTTLNSGLSSSSNNTLTLPITATDTLAGLGTAQTYTAAQTFTNADLLLKGSSSGAMTLEAPAAASTYIMTFPAATDTVATLAASQALTNKDMSGAGNTWPTFNQNTTGSAASLSISGQTGLLTFTGVTSTNRAKTVRDAADTILELGGGSYTPTGTWVWTSASVTWPTFNQNTTGSAAKLTTARNINGVAFDGTGAIVTPTEVDGDCVVGSGGAWAAGSCSTGSGTVTSVATNNGITGGTITTTGTIGLASVSNNTALCNNSGSSAVPTTANCTVTGTGNLVLASSPTLTTAALGSSTATTQTANTNNTDVATTAYVDRTNLKNREVIFGLDGGGSALTAGKIIYRANSPCAGTITGAYLVGSPSGSAVVDVWKIAAGSSLPTVTNTIDASDLPTLSSATVYTDTTLTGWTTTVTAGDMWAIKLNSASTVTSLNLIIDITCN